MSKSSKSPTPSGKLALPAGIWKPSPASMPSPVSAIGGGLAAVPVSLPPLSSPPLSSPPLSSPPLSSPPLSSPSLSPPVGGGPGAEEPISLPPLSSPPLSSPPPTSPPPPPPVGGGLGSGAGGGVGGGSSELSWSPPSSCCIASATCSAMALIFPNSKPPISLS